MHKIDLSKYEFRTDLIDEAINVEHESDIYQNNICIKRIKLDSDDAKEINKKMGSYITISFEDITDFDNRNYAAPYPQPCRKMDCRQQPDHRYRCESKISNRV